MATTNHHQHHMKSCTVYEMFTNQLVAGLRHANVDFDKKEPDIRVWLGYT
jgi:hypothetical protein